MTKFQATEVRIPELKICQDIFDNRHSLLTYCMS